MDNPVSFYHSLLRLGVKPGLERIKELLSELGNPENGLRTVHVAGTNGKGTTSTIISEILSEAGYNTGLYTSPYIIDFRERIKLNSLMIPEAELASVTDEVKAAVERTNKKGLFPTEFEAITAAAFLYYKKEKCDIAVLECGLGGRFDATNVLGSTLCSVIVSISYDHMALLGDTLAKIAWEKAGIIKPGCPVITTKNQKEEALTVLCAEAEKLCAPLTVTDENSMFRVVSEDISGTNVIYRGKEMHIPFCGRHQLENASLALTAVNKLTEAGLNVSDENIIRGTESSFLPARTELICRSPLVILDGSHNEGSTHALADVLEKHMKGKKILAVMGMMADKDIEAAVSELVGHFSAVITVTPSNPRSLPASELARIINGHGIPSFSADSPLIGINTAFDRISDYDALVVCGSLYLAADIRDYLQQITDKYLSTNY